MGYVRYTARKTTVGPLISFLLCFHVTACVVIRDAKLITDKYSSSNHVRKRTLFLDVFTLHRYSLQ
jgi:hypothetical protein